MRSSGVSGKIFGEGSRCERKAGKASLIHCRPGAPEAFANGMTMIVSVEWDVLCASAQTAVPASSAKQQTKKCRVCTTVSLYRDGEMGLGRRAWSFVRGM